MKKSELIAMLNRCAYATDPEIILASDEEGNSFHRLDKGCGIEETIEGEDILVLYPTWDEVEIA
jgi:hypothetical protein